MQSIWRPTCRAHAATTFTRVARSAALFLVAVALSASSGRADVIGSGDEDTLSHFSLTTSNVAKAIAFQDSLAKSGDLKTIRVALAAMNGRSASTLDGSAKGLESNARLTKELRTADLSAREFLLVGVSAMEANLVFQMERARQKLPKDPSGLNRANVSFVGQHLAELDALAESTARLNKLDGPIQQ